MDNIILSLLIFYLNAFDYVVLTFSSKTIYNFVEKYNITITFKKLLNADILPMCTFDKTRLDEKHYFLINKNINYTFDKDLLVDLFDNIYDISYIIDDIICELSLIDLSESLLKIILKGKDELKNNFRTIGEMYNMYNKIPYMDSGKVYWFLTRVIKLRKDVIPFLFENEYITPNIYSYEDWLELSHAMRHSDLRYNSISEINVWKVKKIESEFLKKYNTRIIKM